MCPSVAFLFSRRIDCFSVGMGRGGVKRGKRGLWGNSWDLDSPPKLPLLMAPVWVCALLSIYTLLAASLDPPLSFDSFLGTIIGGFCFWAQKLGTYNKSSHVGFCRVPRSPHLSGLVAVNGTGRPLPLSVRGLRVQDPRWFEQFIPPLSRFLDSVNLRTVRYECFCLCILLFTSRQLSFTSAQPTGLKNWKCELLGFLWKLLKSQEF